MESTEEVCDDAAAAAAKHRLLRTAMSVTVFNLHSTTLPVQAYTQRPSSNKKLSTMLQSSFKLNITLELIIRRNQTILDFSEAGMMGWQ